MFFYISNFEFCFNKFSKFNIIEGYQVAKDIEKTKFQFKVFYTFFHRENAESIFQDNIQF